ncbi:hypothetical protein DOH76_08030 [Salmonella enterica subsp. enterica serovar Oranienburg]|uniref:Uncharacterized protein n=1 Tax=Salmonella enterica TaxID=28901 RepID=A0A742KW40_SALER|nr:hypothetical protein [Salmonella enterica]EBG5024770.1 hypothetical protein [Salmonella enterica subsp. enterica serovar Oranienburg]EAS1264357.1 hypothetical protein [Salmonella enterica]EAT1445992.1 hypothetical protein [Salmonella enterica]EBB1605818.1 hypothetical protein [Salmonella enterica]
MFVPNEWFLDNKYMSGKIAKFSDWNESQHLVMMDQIDSSQLLDLMIDCLKFKSPKHYFMDIMRNHKKEVFDLIETYDNESPLADTPPNIIYAAIVLTQYSRLLYKHVFSNMDSISDFAEFNKLGEGNETLIRNTFTLVLEADFIDFWPFNSQFSKPTSQT